MSSLADQPIRMTSVPFNVPRRTSSTATRCATLECRRKRGHGLFGCFCRPCARRLGEVRERLELELHATTRWGGVNTIPGTKSRVVSGRGKTPICSNPYCANDRALGHAFCDGCEAEGYMEEAA